MSLVFSSVPSRLFHFKVAHNPQPDSPNTFREKTIPDTHKPKHSIKHTPASNIVHICTTPWPWSRQPLPSSQIVNLLNIHHFRPILPSSLCISLRLSRRAISSWQTQCPKIDFYHNASAKCLKQRALNLACDHNNDPAGSVQTLTVLSPTMLPLNPFQSFVLHGFWAASPLAPTTQMCTPAGRCLET